ncbi:MAG TPA: hypothetical protein VM940_11570 [Chthoniobacterales bacterium]|nr:hypothetical protein [Chthoniobacterales bacterium]
MKLHRYISGNARMLLIGSFFVTCRCVMGQELPKNDAALYNLSVDNRDLLLRDIRPLLKATRTAGRLYIASKCLGDSEDVLFFPRIEVNPIQGKLGAAAVQQAVANNKNSKVTQRRPGVIGIWIGDISNDLLSTRIHVLRLGDLERYNYTKAIAAIIDAKEVQAKMRDARIDAVPMVASYPLVYPDPKLPHLPASMTDVTVDEALDRIARTFGGLVIYWECKGEKSTRLFSLLMHEI